MAACGVWSGCRGQVAPDVKTNRAFAARYAAPEHWLAVRIFEWCVPVRGKALSCLRTSAFCRTVEAARTVDYTSMNLRLTRHLGSLLVFAILTGCAMPPSGGDQASALKTGTQLASANPGRGSGRLAAPLAYDSRLNALPSSASNSSDTSSLANAAPITAGPNIGDFEQQGRASWYGRGFHGRKTASGERYDMHALTAAHRTLPLASWVRVTNQANNKSVVVKINDRGPYARGRVIDLSYAAAAVLGMRGAGVGKVKIEGLTQQEARAAQEQEQSLASITPAD